MTMRSILAYLVSLWYGLLERIQEARRPTRPKRDDDHLVIAVPRSMGPVVESPDTKYPVPITRVPLRSTKALAKRQAHAYAEHRVGHQLTWKKARSLLNQWEREERAAARGAESERQEA